MKEKQKEIGIVIPAYNAHDTIRKLLHSIGCLHFLDKVQTIIIDDASEKPYDYLIDDFIMNAFSYMTNTFVPFKEKETLENNSLPQIIQGADLYDKIAPVSKLTGKRENALVLLSRLGNNPEYSRALQALLTDLPTIKSDPRLNDEMRIDMMASRLATGTPAEDDATRKYLESIADVLFKDAPQKVVDSVKDGKIDFTPSDGTVVDDGINS